MYAGMEKSAWLNGRRVGIGGTDASAILGLSPWKTPLTIWLEKMGKATPQEETEAMRIGTELEDYVARSYTRETGREVRNHNRMVSDGGCLIGNIDRLVVPEGAKIAALKGEIRTDKILECKTSSKEWDEDGVPLYYQVQVQHYMGLCPSVTSADLACLFLTFRKHFEIYNIERDDEVIKEMQERLREWWDKHIIHGEPPKPTNEEDCKRLYERSTPSKKIYTSAGLSHSVEKYKQAKARLEAWKEIAQKRKDEIVAAMGDAEAIVDEKSGKPLATWKTCKDTEVVNWERMARTYWITNHPSGLPESEILRFTEKKTGARRFLVK